MRRSNILLMPTRFPALVPTCAARGPKRRTLWLAAACATLLLTATFGAHAQSVRLAAAVLKPPSGARVAIVEFDDLECPACAHANPLLKEAAAKYRIPWVRHDYLIPFHNWSKTAAVNARWFDTRSKALGDEYRDAVFANQPNIYSPAMLNQFTQKFAQSHDIALPFAIDPQGTLLAEVNADVALGKRIGITETPTIYIVTEGPKGPSSMQVQNPDRDLYSTIDKAMEATRR